VDILVNNAGITADKTVRKMTVEDWDRVLQVNLSGAFCLSRAILQHMLDRGYGRIINISSIIGESGNIGQANYAAAKSGLFGLTMSLAQETARKGITVDDVAPGYISTDMVAAVPQEALDKVIAKIPVGRLGEPEEIARTVEFLPTLTPVSSPARSSRSTAGNICDTEAPVGLATRGVCPPRA
jgi:NAD(P)-dependent dehydrogenase (short-subunit alcohol dehydrogenase family)